MSKAYNYLKECGVFFLATNNGTAPAVRPFGAVMEREGILYIATDSVKDVYKQLKANPVIQIVAIKIGSIDWLRLDAKAEECGDEAVRQAMFESNPIMAEIFKSVDNPGFVVFALRDVDAKLYKPDIIEDFN